MASTYSMSPYAISLKPRYDRGSEKRPIDDGDGKGKSIRQVIDGLLEALHGPTLIVDPADDTKWIRASRLEKLREVTFADFGIGKSGLVGNLHPENGAPVPYGMKDRNETMVRSLFVYPSGGHEVFWMSERASSSAFGFLESRLRTTLREAFPELTVKIDPVAEWSALQAWSAAVSVKEMRFDAPRNNSSSQAMLVNGVNARVRVTVTPKAGLKLNRLVKATGPDRPEVFGFLSDAVPGSASATGMMQAGWTAQVAFQTPTGRQRSFGITTEDKAPTLIYTVGNTAGMAANDRPSNHDFAEACLDFGNEIKDRLPIGTSALTEIENAFPL